jgi:hypothetical protein
MIIESKPSEIKTSSNFTELEFGIKQADMGLVLEILRSKMYKNPIAAICREVASNSRDANRESENNIPIEIGICNSKLLASDCTIYFKDFGPGISKDRMADVFVNYGASTKRDTNIYTGGFGLGAKTPFSYADNFSIETIVDDTKYTYVAAIEEGKKGKIYLIDSQPCDEHTGTTIIIPIKRDDISSFEEEVIRATGFWEMKPIYKNFRYQSTFKYQTFYEDEKVLLLEEPNRTFDFTYGLLLDGILYQIDSNIMRFASHSLWGKMIIYKFDVGELTISANREALQYDNKTIEVLKTRNKELIDICSAKWKSQLDACPSWLHACLYYIQKSSNIYYNILEAQEIKDIPKDFKSEKLSKNLDFFKTFQFFDCCIDCDNKISRSKITQIGNELITKPIFLLDETSTFSTARDTTIFKNTKQFVGIKVNDQKAYRFSELTFKEKKSFASIMRAVINDKKFLDDHGFTYTKYSTVEKTKIVKTVNGTTQVNKQSDAIKVYKFNVLGEGSYSEGYRNRHYNPYKGEYTYITLDQPLDENSYCYVLVDDISQISSDTENIQMLRYAMKLNLITPFTIIYTNKNRGKGLIGMLNTLDEKIQLLTPDIISKIIDHDQEHELMEEFGWLTKMTFKTKKFETTVAKLKCLSKIDKKIHVTSTLLEKYKNLSMLPVASQEFKDLIELCPMLRHIGSWERKESRYVKEINDYVNLVEIDLLAKNQIQ